jgi:hypothetical protein
LIGSIKIIGEYTNTIKKNKNGLLDANKKVGLHVNAEKTRCYIRHQNLGQNRKLKIAISTLKIWGNDINKSKFCS